MRLKRHENVQHLRDYKDVTVAGGLTVRVYALPWNFDADFERDIPKPSDDNDEDYGLLRMAAVLYECLDAEDVSWESRRGDDASAFYRAIGEEIKAFMTPRQALKLARQAADLMNVTEGDVEEAKEDFLSGAATPEEDLFRAASG